jgi:Uma2 family endonuclease
MGDLLRRVPGVAPDRIRLHPEPGTATVADVVEIERTEGKLCELVDGILVEKVMGYPESLLAVYLITVLNTFVMSRKLGLVAGADGMMELFPGRIRIPDVSFIRWDRVPGDTAPTEPVPALAPNLAVEVLSKSNTRAEMDAKRLDYFNSGAELVWEVEPKSKTVTVYKSLSDSQVLHVGDTLMGDPALPGFSLSLAELFTATARPG